MMVRVKSYHVCICVCVCACRSVSKYVRAHYAKYYEDTTGTAPLCSTNGSKKKSENKAVKRIKPV